MSNAQPIQIIGRVLRAPEVRTAIDSVTLRTIPLLCLTLAVEGQDRPVHIEQEFCFANMTGAQAAAQRYRPGSLLKVDVDMSAIQLTFRQVEHIHLLERPPAPTLQPTTGTES